MRPEAEKVDVVKEQVSASPLGEASGGKSGKKCRAGVWRAPLLQAPNQLPGPPSAFFKAATAAHEHV